MIVIIHEEDTVDRIKTFKINDHDPIIQADLNLSKHSTLRIFATCFDFIIFNLFFLYKKLKTDDVVVYLMGYVCFISNDLFVFHAFVALHLVHSYDVVAWFLFVALFSFVLFLYLIISSSYYFRHFCFFLKIINSSRCC
eukprot:558500_1